VAGGHHPLLYRYGVLTGETVAALRDFLVPRGWEVRNEGNYELVSHPELNVSIAVASGNEATGDRLRIPSNKNEKGPRTAKAVKDNQTADLFPETVPCAPEGIVATDTWILLHHRSGNEIRLELSRPNGFDDTERFVTGWSERILLGSYPGTRRQRPHGAGRPAAPAGSRARPPGRPAYRPRGLRTPAGPVLAAPALAGVVRDGAHAASCRRA
jgi:hypothetical protein